MVLLETAVAIPALLVVAVALAWVLSLATTSIALADAARSAARDLARGIAVEEALQRAQALVPGSTLEVVPAGDAVTVVARRSMGAAVPILSGLQVPLEQSVTVPREWA